MTAIQTLLARLGYDPGPANGVVGLKTNMAISAFQKSIGQRGDGHPSEAVRAQLEKAVAARGAARGRRPPRAAVRPRCGRRDRSPEGSPAPAPASSSRPTRVVTNFHVVNGCGELRLRKNGGDSGGVRLLATSRSDDLAALRAPAPARAS